MDQINQIIHLQEIYRLVQQLKTEQLNTEEVRDIQSQLVEQIFVKEKQILKMEENHQVQISQLKVEVERLSRI